MAIWTGASGVWKPSNDWDVGASSAHKNMDGMWVGAGGVWKAVKPLLLKATGVAGTDGLRVGYSGAHGTMVPSTIGSNYVFVWVDDEFGRGSVRIAGFFGDPGATWATFFKINGTAYAASSGTYSFTSGVASWLFTGQTFGFTNGVAFTAEIG